jgi:hypothetical protein
MSAKCQEATYAPQQKAILFDHLIGEGEQIVGDFNAQRLRRFQVDRHLKFRGLRDW